MSRIFNLEQPPESLDTDVKEYLSRTFALINIAIQGSDQLIKHGAIPNKLSIGKLYYFIQAVLNEPAITSEGLYIYQSNGWQKIT